VLEGVLLAFLNDTIEEKTSTK